MKTTQHESPLHRQAIDADIADSATRLLLGEWLNVLGDERAAGFTWMGRHHKYPYFLPASRKWSWTNLRNADPVHNHLPPELYEALPEGVDADWKKYQHENDAEEELARTFGRLGESSG